MVGMKRMKIEIEPVASICVGLFRIKVNIHGADAPDAGSNFLRATRILFKEPNHLARDSSSGAHRRYDLSSAII
jgi:hypothetical protein